MFTSVMVYFVNIAEPSKRSKISFTASQVIDMIDESDDDSPHILTDDSSSDIEVTNPGAEVRSHDFIIISMTEQLNEYRTL